MNSALAESTGSARGRVHGLLNAIALFVFAFASPVALALDPTEKPANYIATHWDTEDGLPHNSVRQIFQTRDGYLWIATQLGLARFDGISFTVFNRHNTPVMQSNSITSMAETSDGSLWIGTGVGLLRYRDGTFTCFDRSNGMKSETINSVCVAPDGSLWIGSRDGVVRWVDGKFVRDIDTSAYDTFGLRNITVDRQNAIWLAMGRGALRYHNGAFTAFTSVEGLTGQLDIISEDPEGQTVAVTQEGLLRLVGGRFVPLKENQALSSVRLNRILVDQAGSMWVGSVGGLDRCRVGSVVPYVDRFGKKLGVINSIMEDREGCVWVGSAGGLYRLTDRRASSLTEEDGIRGHLVSTVQQTRDGSLWVSSWGAGVTRLHNDTLTRYTVGSPLSHETITAIYEAPNGVMWFGNRGSSVDRLADGKVTTYVFASGVATSRPVTALMMDDDGTLLIGIASRGLLQLRDEQISIVPELTELNTKRATVQCIFRSSAGQLLIGTTNGVYQRRSDRTWQSVELPGLSAPVWVRTIIEVDGVLWLATDGHGLVRWKNGEARSYGVREGMVADAIFSVVDDGQGAFWVSSARGLARIRKEEFSDLDRGSIASLHSLTFGRVDGLLSAASSGEGSPGAIRLTDGRIMTATDKGVAVVHPPSLRVNLRPPTVVIENVLADEQKLAVSPEIKIAAGSTRLEIRFTALSLIVPERLRFRYLLEGSDKRWVEAGYARSAHYTHLAPGRYKFTVLASNNDGVWTETGTSIAITLLPRFYQTLWFGFASVVGFLAIVGFIAGFRIRQLQRRELELARANVELDLRVKERTADLSRSHADIQQRELLFRLIFEHAPVGISWSRADLGPEYHFNSAFRRILDLPSGSLPDNTLLDELTHPDDAVRQAESEAKLRSGQADSYAFEQRFVRKDGRQVSALLAVAIVRDDQGKVIQHIRILEDISALKQTEQELAQTYQRLMEASRMAGKAEVATSVLHNVGNVLNSVNVSTHLVVDQIRQTKAANIAKVAALMEQHKDELADFLLQDPRGRMIPGYLSTLGVALTDERRDMLAELEHLRENVEHINEIVAMQQSNARSVGVIENIAVADILEDVLRINSGSPTRHQVEIVREFRDRPVIATDRHKVMQILINLVGNANQACDAADGTEKRIIIRVTNQDHAVKIAVVDTGIGIAPENLNRIFHHGFTTKKDGHGFGLHSGALAARELGGSLSVESAGTGQGATFTLELPLQQAPAEVLVTAEVS